MGRLEFKYLIKEKHLDDMRRYMAPYVSLDPYAAREDKGEYTVHSIYLDTMNLDSYYNKLAGIKVRKKFRIRGYNDVPADSLVFLEIKRKNVNTISKTRSPVEFSKVESLLNTGDYDSYVYTNNGVARPKEQAKNFLFYYFQRDLRPSIKISYDREPFVYKFDRSLRITYDKHLRSSLNINLKQLGCDEGSIESLPGYFIIEVKSHRPFPKWLDYLIAELHVQHQALSKYTISIDTHRKHGRRINTLTNYSRQSNGYALDG